MTDQFVSYSQNGEDVVLWRALKDLKTGFYVDIGAGWAKQHSVTKAFSLRGWTGINVDPNPAFHADLLADRPNDISLCLGVSDRHEVIPFMVIEDTGLSTFDADIAADHRKHGWKTQEVRTETITLAELLGQHVPAGQDVHFLKIDAEGFEEKIIGSNDWAKYRPWIVVCESTAPLSVRQTHQGFEKTLLAAGYVFALFDGLNRYYVASEHNDLVGRLDAPANPLDDYITIDLKEAREQLEERHRDVERTLSELDAANRSAEEVRERLAERDRDVERARDDLGVAIRSIEGMQERLAARDRDIERSRDELSATNHAVEETREQLAERDGELERVRGELDVANRAAEEVQEWLAERDGELERVRGELDVANRAVEEAQEQLAERDGELERIRSELVAANRMIEETQQGLADRRRDLERAGEELNFSNHQLEQVYRSTSWKLTRPVRDVKLALLSGRRVLLGLVRKTALHTPLKRAYLKYHNNRNAISLGGGFTYYDFRDFVLAFDKNPCVDRRGIGRVANALAAALDAMAPIVPEPATGKPVVYFFPSVHWVPRNIPQPNVVMIHDVIPLIFPDAFPAGVVDEWKGKFADIARSADKVLTISNSSADSIAEKLGIERSNIVVNYNGVVASKAALEDNVLLPKQKFFCILGSADYHKNFQVVFEAFRDERLSEFHLVVIGEGEAYQRFVVDHPAKERIHLLSRVKDGTVFEVLRRAEALLFPSLYEGFGLPPFEAALQGTPAICSRRPAMDELFSDECLFAPHDQPTAWSDAMLKLASTPGMRSKLAKKAAQRAQDFTWKKSAIHLVEICRQHGLATNSQE